MKFNVNLSKDEEKERKSTEVGLLEAFLDFSIDHPLIVYGTAIVLGTVVSYKVCERCMAQAIYRANMKTFAHTGGKLASLL